MKDGAGNGLIANVLYRIFNGKADENPGFGNCGF
ncbi:unknown [Odoribacter sp. CAG:788]|nr:unknown [Odoribacter sp. CAG:788]